jgi:hypothetical protein
MQSYVNTIPEKGRKLTHFKKNKGNCTKGMRKERCMKSWNGFLFRNLKQDFDVSGKISFVAVYLMKQSDAHIIPVAGSYKTLNSRWIKKSVKGSDRGTIWANIPGFTWKTKNLSEGSQCPCRDSSRAPPTQIEVWSPAICTARNLSVRQEINS